MSKLQIGELGAEETRKQENARRRRRRHHRRRSLTILVVVLALLGASSYFVVGPLKNIAAEFGVSNADYTGDGKGEVVIDIPEGSSGRTVANILLEADVIKASKPFIKAVEAGKKPLQAGVYPMKKQMSAQAAYDRLIDPPTLDKVAIPEGFRLKQISERIQLATGLSKDEVDAAVNAKPETYGLPKELPSLEGFLYPATYDIKEDVKAKAIVQSMVDRLKEQLKKHGVEEKDELKVLTLASLIQVEAPNNEEARAQVSRALQNRLDPKINKETAGFLQLDSTIAYIHGARADASTTKDERKTESPYNTYLNKGLPVGPINSPGADTIEAALNPAEGNWLYWVTINPETGETLMADNYADHQKNVKKYQEWLRDHQSDDSGG
ncbi:endolytic transglycosylase MltG [Saxibacter everestensis]|uniref:Endolytic murein transglycosylase n=1 Tax=Saxibacter everestensis TaxID=2909229 RepID=A0ABY8R012_9MICO|nr:endolytic transglycosylase MltG [Brevibacteriaceae bacterium ZFBP1038]